MPERPDEERWYIVVTVLDGVLTGFSRRKDGERGPFTGEWQLLTHTEATRLHAALEADPADGLQGGPGETHIVEVYRYTNDPDWPEEYA